MSRCLGVVWIVAAATVTTAPASAASQRIAGIAFASNDHVYTWFRDGVVTTGTPRHFEEHSHARRYQLPPGEKTADIVAMSIASNDQVYAWFADGKTSTGNATDLDQHHALRSFSLPPGKTTANIVGIAIAQQDHVYAWFDDSTYSIGTATDLDAHQAPRAYRVPAGKAPRQIVEIDVAKSNNRVHAWYLDGTGSAGDAAHLDGSTTSFGYVPSQVLYRWWGPGRIAAAPFHGEAGETLYDHDRMRGDLDPAAAQDRRTIPAAIPPLPDDGGEPGNGPPPPTPPPPPAPITSYPQSLGAIDSMVAVGREYVIASTTGTLVFLDRSGNQLPVKHGVPTRIASGEFFAGLVAPTNADGSVNEHNINLYLRLPKPCNSPDYPQLASGDRFCIATFYDTRVVYDDVSRRFFVISNSRHALWPKDCVDGGTKCSCYAMDLALVPDQSVCTEIKSGQCNISTDDYCDLARRYVAFAVSRSEDPRDGFHQYILTENNVRDWPWQAVNGNHYVVTHKGKGTLESPVATVFSVDALKDGVEHPPFFRYYSEDVGGLRQKVLPPFQYQSQAGRTFLLGAGENGKLHVFAFPQSVDPWKAPPLQTTSVTLGDPMPQLFGAVYRQQRLYLVGSVLAGTNGSLNRSTVQVFRVPLEATSGTTIKAWDDAAHGFRRLVFGARDRPDPPGDRYSYEVPSIAVNSDHVVMAGYVRRPYVGTPPLQPQARISLWYPDEDEFRYGRTAQAGEAADPGNLNDDYTTATVDPNGKTMWFALPYVNAAGKYRVSVGRVEP